MGRNKYWRKNKNKKALKNNAVIGQSEMEKRLASQFKKPVELINCNNVKVKISEVFSQMIDPLMENAKSFSEQHSVVGIGVLAWNLGVLKTYKGEEEMLKSMAILKMPLPDDIKKLITEFVEIKCTDYAQYDQYIFDFEFNRISDKGNNISLAYKSINE